MNDDSPRGLIVDFYGVLTDGMDAAMRAWSELDDIEYAQFQHVMADWLGDVGAQSARFNPVHALERGEIEVPDFERRLAKRLKRRTGELVEPHGLLERMFARFQHAPDMSGLVRRVRGVGARTALLSNSWGDQYFRSGWEDLFDTVVISGEVGMRKPEARIFHYTLDQLSLPGSACVFVDDHRRNVQAATALGITSLLHVDYRRTAAEVEKLFGVPPVSF